MKRYGKLLLILLCGLALLAALTLTAAAYNHGTCIDQVYVHIREPWPGSPLDFTAEMAGSTGDYEIDTTVNGDGYVNGVRWYDCTEKRNMLNYEEDRAILGHQYRLEIAFKAKKANHYFWIDTRNGVPITDFQINNSNKLNISGSGNPNTYTFNGGTLTKFFYACEQVNDINVMAYELPVDEERLSFEAAGLHESHTVEKVVWTDLTSGITITEDDPRCNFIGGREYAVSFWVLPQPGYMFGTLRSVTANGISGSRISYERYEANDYYDSIGYIVTLQLGACPKAIKTVNLTVPAPEAYQKPATSVTVPANAHYRTGGEAGNDGMRWYKNGVKMGVSDVFESGYIYELQVDVWADDGYRFPLKNASTEAQPDVTATINGKTAQALRVDGEDPAGYFTVRYSFGKLDSTVIDTVTIVDVVEPVAGEKPSYEALALGQDYAVDTDASYEYAKNGVYWYDVTKQKIQDANDPFVAGHTYSVTIYLQAEGDYTFLGDGSTWTPYFRATVNGTDAIEIMDNSHCKEAQVICEFYCEPKYISTAILYDLDAPVAGQTPDTQVTAAYPEAYTVSSVRWFGDESQLTGSAKFEAEKTYRAVVQITPTEFYAFTEGAAVVLDNAPLGASTKVEVFSPDDTHSDGVYFDGTHLWVCRTFWRAAAAPEIAEPVSFSWNGSECTLFLNEPQNCIVMAAAYQGGKLTGTTVLVQTQQPILTLTGDQVKVFFLDYTSYAPLQNAIVKPQGVQ